MALENMFFRRSYLERLHVIANHCKSRAKHTSLATSSNKEHYLLLSKTDALVDEKVCITASGLQRGQKVTLQTNLNVGNKIFGSCGHFVADDDGIVNTFEHESHGGTFSGMEPMGLFWSMKSSPGDKPRRLLSMNVSRPFDIEISLHSNFIDFNNLPWLESDPPPLTSCKFQQRFMDPSVKSIPVREDGLIGTLFLPDGEGPFPAIIDVFGMAGVSTDHRSSLLASRGIASFTINYVGQPGLAQSMEDLDFNYFLRAFDWLSRHPSVNSESLGGLGSCIGAAYVSLIAWKRPAMRCFVGINSPPRPDGRTQTVEGDLVEQVAKWRMELSKTIEGALSFRPLGRVEDNVPCLPYWRHGVKVLHIQGEDDQCVNPDALIASLKDIPEKFRDNFEFISYPGAGHILEPPYMPLCRMNYNNIFKSMLFWGGQPKPHADAQVDSWPRIIKFFKQNLTME